LYCTVFLLLVEGDMTFGMLLQIFQLNGTDTYLDHQPSTAFGPSLRLPGQWPIGEKVLTLFCTTYGAEYW